MPRYKANARLYIDKKFVEAGSEFATAEALPNESLLASTGSIDVLPDKPARRPEKESEG